MTTNGSGSGVLGVISDTVIPAVGSGISYLTDGFNYLAKNAPILTGAMAGIAAFMGFRKLFGEGFLKTGVGLMIGLTVANVLSRVFADEPEPGQDMGDRLREAVGETAEDFGDVIDSGAGALKGVARDLGLGS